MSAGRTLRAVLVALGPYLIGAVLAVVLVATASTSLSPAAAPGAGSGAHTGTRSQQAPTPPVPSLHR